MNIEFIEIPNKYIIHERKNIAGNKISAERAADKIITLLDMHKAGGTSCCIPKRKQRLPTIL